MIVFHALWENIASGTLYLWAESSNKFEAVQQNNLVATRRTSALPHPFALASADCRSLFGEFAGSLLAQSAHVGTVTLRLPSTSKGPLSSPDLLVEHSSSSNAVTLRWWTIDALLLDASAAFDLLLALPVTAPHGIVFGDSLRFWATAARFAFELLSHQRYIPALHDAQRGNVTTCRALWSTVLSPEDRTRVHTLAQLMPPLCWSFTTPGEKSATLLQEMVQHFLEQCIDAFIRESLVSTPLLPSTKRAQKHTAHVTTLPERWFRALALPGADAFIEASPASVKQFSNVLHSWLDQAALTLSTAPFRTCFRLEAPEVPAAETGDDAALPWRVTFHLQANDDPSLLVPAEQVWNERSGTLTFLKRNFENPQERLLTDLGKAARLFPPIENSLQSARPQELVLNTEQAYHFLRQIAPLLEESGFGVLVPPWWKKGAARLQARLKFKSKADAGSNTSLLGLDGLVAYDWNLALGDTQLTLKEFEKLVKLKMPLVQVRGQWVELRPQEVEAAIAFFKKQRGQGQMSLSEVLRLGLGQDETEIGLPVAAVEGDGWIDEMLKGLQQTATIAPIQQPASLQGTLRPYQLKGVSWLAFLSQFGLGACLADDMGLGKTPQLIAFLLHQREKAALRRAPTLLICPMSIVGNWQREVQRFAPSLSILVHHGLERLAGQALLDAVERHDLVLTTYSLALRDKETLGQVAWENVVLDEAQNIKNEMAKQTQAIKQLKARYKIALTGTPVENRLAELWSIMEFLNPGYLGSGEAFRKSFAIPIERYHDAERTEMLKHLIQPFVLRRQKTDKAIIQDLPDKMEMKVFCNLTREQASLYEAVVQEMMERIEAAEGMERRGLILATLTKLKQVCNHPAQFMGDGSSLPRRSGKLIRLQEMLEEVASGGDKALIFTQYAEMGTMLRHYLQEELGYETLFLRGSTQKKQRDLLVQRFQEEKHGAPFFILSLKAGGVGLNLTAANHVFHFDRWWNPAVENQATDRAFRIGQQRNVQVHKFVCIGTLEERIDQMIEQKKELAESIVGSGENWLTEMSTSQLKDLFALGREAIGE